MNEQEIRQVICKFCLVDINYKKLCIDKQESDKGAVCARCDDEVDAIKALIEPEKDVPL